MAIGKFDTYWVQSVKDQILNTFGDRQWLMEHFSQTIVADAGLAEKLAINGQGKSNPVAVLETAQQLTTELAARYAGSMTQYARAITSVTNRLPALARPNMSDAEARAFLDGIRSELVKIPVPIPEGTRGPVFFGGWSAAIDDGGVVSGRPKTLPAQRSLPAITFDHVYKAAHLMVEQLDVILQAPLQIPWAGVDMFVAGPWDKLDARVNQELMDLVSMDGTPGMYHDFIWSYYYEWGMLLQSVAQWLYLSCQPDNE